MFTKKHYKNTNKTKWVIVLAFVLFSTDLMAQVINRLRVGVDFGIVKPEGSTDVIVGTEIKYQINSKSKIGCRIEGGGISKKIKRSDGSYFISESRMQVGFITSFEYTYLQGSNWTLFVETGLGYYALADLSASSLTAYIAQSFNPKFGGLLKTGFEFEKFRLTLAYQYIPTTNTTINAVNQHIKNTYFSTSIGYFIGK